MHASGSREVYTLKQPGREYLRDTDALVNRELDYYNVPFQGVRPQ